MAWLHTAPEGQNKGTEEKESRAETFEKSNPDHVHLGFPPLESHDYIIEWFLKIGPVAYSGMGPIPLPMTELENWGKDFGITLWEKETLRELSKAYISMSQKAEKRDCAPPFVQEVTAEYRASFASSLRDRLMAFKPKKKSGVKGK